jgi:hypothetical protein
MRRREFIAGLSGAATWPVVARAAQQMPVVGYLYFGSATSPLLLAAFRKGLGDTGGVEGKNVTSSIAGRTMHSISYRNWRRISFVGALM